jgi:hypothetical protein
MDLSALNELLITLNNKTTMHTFNNSMSLFCSLLLILVLFTDKKFNSSSIGILVLCLGVGLESIALPNLVQIASTEALLNYFVWYGGWIGLKIICLLLLLKFHRFYQLRVSDLSITLVWYYVISAFIHAIDFIERATFDSGVFATFYQLSNLLLSVLIAPVLGLMFFREYYQRRRLLKLQGL